MQLTININETTPDRRVINVRQFSSAVDHVTFILDTCPISGEVSAYMVEDQLRQEIGVQTGAGTTTAQWDISAEFTKTKGFHQVQLRLEGEGKIWLSDVMLLIVSESTEGSIPAAAPAEQIITAQLNIDAIIQQDIIFEYEEE